MLLTSAQFTWSVVQMNCIVSLLTFCLNDLSIEEAMVVKSPAIIVLECFPSISVFLYMVHVPTLSVCVCLYI